ncbi:MAG: RecQ family ATP-dependent DNA helicase [Anaerolineae bacterium]|nr:RecQ family ATP-dependent DNA helicase [Anaerolineae bacterium]
MDDIVSILEKIGLTMSQVRELSGRDRRLLSFLLRWERFAELHACLDELIPRNPTHVSLLDLRSRALLAQDRPDEALSVMENRLQHKDSSVARALLARIYLANGDAEAARQAAEAVVVARSESSMAWSLLGEVELACGDEEAALRAYRHLHDLHPNSRAYLWGMVSIYSAQGDWVTASGYAVRLLRLADKGDALSVAYLRRLHGYFQLSGETTRQAEMEAKLEHRYAEELTELREHFSPVGGPESAPKPRRPKSKRHVSEEMPCEAPAEPLLSFDDVPISDEERRTIAHAVRQFFGFDSLLPGQLETMACVLRGEDVLTVLPTGGGKSLCYQLPALLAEGSGREFSERGTALVISPLIALMKDQIDSLPRKVRRRATTINSTLDGDELRRRMDQIADGVYRLVYAAPERLRQPPFLHALRRAPVKQLVVDEAHCVSMWGHDFRPDYLIIGRTRKALGDPPLLAMTATAPTRVRQDILEQLRSPRSSADGPQVVAGDVTRANLQLEVFQASGKDAKLRYLLAFCQAEKGSGIVYADTRARCERLAALLRQHGVNAAHYHAGIADRHQAQDDFMSNRTRVVVATIAFGLGIDKPDIRFIVHFFPPASLEAYYQEAGRAGRDGLPARCVLMISPYDKGLMTRRMRRDVMSAEFLREVYRSVKRHLDGESLGRVVMADLERDLRTDDTRMRVALSLLEEVGLLWRGQDVPRAALVRLSAVCRNGVLPEELEAFRRAAHLRPQQWLTLDLAQVAPKAGIAMAEIEEKVLSWEDAGWLDYRPAGRDPLVELLPPPEDASERVETLLERYETVQLQRVDEISAYASTSRCRHGHINAYLGGRAIERCRACDNCLDISPLPDPGLPDERKQLLTVLRCVANAPWNWGRQTLVRILCGEGRARYGRHSLHAKARGQAEFGALSFRSKTAIERMVERLEHGGFLAPRQLRHGGAVLDLTTKGRAALRDPAKLVGSVAPEEPRSPARRSADDEELDVDEDLFATLRAWRLEQARAQEVPAFVIFHDTHLRAIAAHKPTTREALMEVNGVGPVKLERYGDSVIGLVAEHVRDEGD